MDGIMLNINENGECTLYKEPYISIECDTEEDYKRFEYLLKLGKATEKAFSETASSMCLFFWEADESKNKFLDEDKCFDFENADDLLAWYEKWYEDQED